MTGGARHGSGTEHTGHPVRAPGPGGEATARLRSGRSTQDAGTPPGVSPRAAPAGPRQHGSWPARLLPRRRAGVWAAAGLVVLLTAGCATKRDVKELRDEMLVLQARQDSLVARITTEIRARNREVLDSVAAQTALVTRMRGDFNRQLSEMEQQIIITQELAGQGQARLAELREQIQGGQRLGQPLDPEGEHMPPAEPTPAPAGAPEELYAVGMDQLRRQAPGTARQAFEQLLLVDDTHERAPDAQFQIAETYVLEENYEQAFDAFERVVQDYPESRRAPQALYRAGILAEQQDDEARARQFFERLLSGFPNAEEAALARDRIPE